MDSDLHAFRCCLKETAGGKICGTSQD